MTIYTHCLCFGQKVIEKKKKNEKKIQPKVILRGEMYMQYICNIGECSFLKIHIDSGERHGPFDLYSFWVLTRTHGGHMINAKQTALTMWTYQDELLSLML